MKIQCNKCKFEFEITIPSSVSGKKIKFKCKNKECREDIELRIPKSGSYDASTIISKSNDKIVKSANLEVIPNELTGFQRFELLEGINTIGRKSDNRKAKIQIVSNDTDISRIHCSIKCFKDKLGTTSFLLKDEASTNGLLLNDEKLDENQEVFLMQGDVIRMGNTSLLFIPEFK